MKLEKPPQGLAHDTTDTDLMPLPVSWNHVPFPYGVTALWSALPGRMSGESSTLAFKPRSSLGSVRAGALLANCAYMPHHRLPRTQA